MMLNRMVSTPLIFRTYDLKKILSTVDEILTKNIKYEIYEVNSRSFYESQKTEFFSWPKFLEPKQNTLTTTKSKLIWKRMSMMQLG